MKIFAYRSTMPFDNRGADGMPSISPTTDKSVMPFNNVPTIQDILEKNINLKDYNPHSGGNWAPGEDTFKSYKETGDDYKRRERDLGILNFMAEHTPHINQKWVVRVPGGSKNFMSFELARQYTRQNNIPFRYISRVAQNINNNEQLRVDVIADSLNKTFMVESINVNKGTRDTGSAFCVAPNLFLTCAHVIKSYNKNNKIEADYFSDSLVYLINNNEKVPAYIIDIDATMDIAMIQCNIDSEPFEIDNNVEVGRDIIAIGSPHGYENNVSNGIIGSLGKKVYFYQGAPEYMFIDLSVFPGNSGGPVVSVDNGKIVGMVTLIVSGNEGDGGYGLNAALPSKYILNFLSNNI